MVDLRSLAGKRDPSPASGIGAGEDMDARGRATQEQLPRRGFLPMLALLIRPFALSLSKGDPFR